MGRARQSGSTGGAGRLRRPRGLPAILLLGAVLGALPCGVGGAAAEDEAEAPAAVGLPARLGPERARAWRTGGGTKRSETAARRALDWLAAHQEEDGRLDADGFMAHDPEDARCDGAGGGHHGEQVPCPFDGAATAAALMAWLAGGSTPGQGTHAIHVARALRWCRREVDRGAAGDYALLNQGWCVQAVADAYWMLRAAEDRVRLEKAVQRLCARQRPDGGWSYIHPVGDVPTTAIVASALALCARAGLEVPASSTAASIRFLDARVDPETGRSEYHDGAERKGYTPTRANTAAALAVRGLQGSLPKTRALRTQLAAIRETPVWKLEFKELEVRGRKVRTQIGNLYPYRWYHTTVALHAQGGAAWRRWSTGLQKALLKGQRREGPCAGSWDPLGPYSDSAGRVFVTALCALMLQAPVRYPRPS